jgi:hypothetical protein
VVYHTWSRVLGSTSPPHTNPARIQPVRGLIRDLYGAEIFGIYRNLRDFNLILDMKNPNHENHFINSSTFASLKILHLGSITHLAKNMVEALFSNCQHLEALKLVKCNGLQRLDLRGGIHFESFEMVDCPEVININLSAPNLRSFRYHGVLPCIQIEETSSLTSALLDFGDGPGHSEFDCEEFISLLKALKDVEILTLTGWLLEVLNFSPLLILIGDVFTFFL